MAIIISKRGELMKKKIFLIVMIMILCFSLIACGSEKDDTQAGEPDVSVSEETDNGIDPNATVTKEKYSELRNSKWSELTPEEMEQFLGVKYVEDVESTEDWGEGYLVVDFPGPDENSFVHVLFKSDETGKMTGTSMSATGQLMLD